MGESAVNFPWQYNFPPFFTIQENPDTRKQQLAVYRQFVVEVMRASKQCFLDIRQASKYPMFCNDNINRQLSEEGIRIVLKDLQRTGLAEPIDKEQSRWYVFWEPLEETAQSVRKWAIDRGMTNTVCTIYELTDGDATVDQSFYRLDQAVMEKALKKLELEKKAELFEIDNSKGVKFF